MKDCEYSLDLLQDFVDGVLPQGEDQEIETHLGSCARCGNEVEALRALLRRASALRVDASPERDLWPSIEAAIRHRPPHREDFVWTIRLTKLPLYAAAAALFLVLVTASVTVLITRQLDSRPMSTASNGDPASAGAIQGAVPAGDAAFLEARRALLTSYESRKSDLPAETVAVIEENHEILLAAQRELAAAMKRDPGNADLAQLLAATWRREIELLQSAVQMPASPEPDSSLRSRI